MNRMMDARLTKLEKVAGVGAPARLSDDDLVARIIADCEAAAVEVPEMADHYRAAAERYRSGPAPTAAGWDEYIEALQSDLRIEVEQLRAAGVTATDLSRVLGLAV